jgi:hypothetical protein
MTAENKKIEAGDILINRLVPAWHDWHRVKVVSVDLLGGVEFIAACLADGKSNKMNRVYCKEDAKRFLKREGDLG